MAALPESGSARGFFLLRTGDWIEEKFRCNLLVSLARKLFLNWLYMNYGLDYDYNELNSNLLELDYIN